MSGNHFEKYADGISGMTVVKNKTAAFKWAYIIVISHISRRNKNFVIGAKTKDY